MGIFTIPSDDTGYMDSWFASMAGANKSTNFEIDLIARPSGGVFQLKHRNSLVDKGTTHIQHRYKIPEVFQPFTDIEMRAQAKAAGVTEAAVSAGFDLMLIKNI